MFAVIDSGVAEGWPDIDRDLMAYVEHHASHLELVAPPFIMQGGEEAKNDSSLPCFLQKRLHELGMDRHSIVIVIGGGALLDLVGYAAATTHRGVRLIRCPTTVLSQADGGLGVKSAVNAFGVKNFLGVFASPFAVINDSRLLRTLPLRHLISGMAEAVKVAVIRDAEFFSWLEANAGALRSAEPSALSHLIRWAAEIHLDHIASCGDPFETGSARPLDFGHWAAHKLESLTSCRLHHGEAVAIGIAIDARYSVELGWLSVPALMRIMRLLTRLGLPVWCDVLDSRDDEGRPRILTGLEEFREHIGGDLVLTMLKQIGIGHETNHVDHALLQRSLAWLGSWQLTQCRST